MTMANWIGLAEMVRLLEVTEDSNQNFEDWDSPSTLLFTSRQFVRCLIKDMYEEYYGQFHDQLEYCLHVLFK